MSLIGSGKAAVPLPRQPRDDILALAARLYRDGAYGESYRLLAPLEQELAEEAAFHAQMALCHMQAEEWQTALVRLEKALACAKKQPPPSPSFPADAALRRLEERQAEGDCYLRPMPAEVAAMLPEYQRQSILRLMIDVYVKLEQWEDVLRLGNALRAKGYSNVNKALELAQSYQRGEQ